MKRKERAGETTKAEIGTELDKEKEWYSDIRQDKQQENGKIY